MTKKELIAALANQLINMGMQNEYELTSIGMLGPFRECF